MVLVAAVVAAVVGGGGGCQLYSYSEESKVIAEVFGGFNNGIHVGHWTVSKLSQTCNVLHKNDETHENKVLIQEDPRKFVLPKHS